MAYLLFLTSLSIASVAAWYSIAGLVAIFAASVVPVIIMGSVLEVGKLVTTSWLYRNWSTIPLFLKSYLTFAVLILMLITSMGIFGFLSKAHLEQTITAGGNTDLRIEMLERQIATENKKINDSETVISQLDQAVETLIKYERIRGPDGSLAVRKSQQEERDQLNAAIKTSFDKINEYELELMPLRKTRIQLEAEVGPLKYIAELIYGEKAKNHFDETVRWVIILLVLVFDPLAVLLMIAANMTLLQNKKSKLFYDDGNLRVDPNNVYIAEEPIIDQSQDFSVSYKIETTPEEIIQEQEIIEDLPDEYHMFESIDEPDEPNEVDVRRKYTIEEVDNIRKRQKETTLLKKWSKLNREVDRNK